MNVQLEREYWLEAELPPWRNGLLHGMWAIPAQLIERKGKRAGSVKDKKKQDSLFLQFLGLKNIKSGQFSLLVRQPAL